MEKPKEIAQQFEDVLKAELKSKVFPEYSERLGRFAKLALAYESQSTLGCGLDTYEAIARGDNDFYTASFAINAVQARTPKDLAMYLPEYLELQQHVAELAAKWNGYVQPIKEKLSRKFQAQARISQGVPKSKLIGLPQA